MFNGKSKIVLVEMYSRQVESADDVISHLEVEADDRLHDTMAQKFKDCLIRYLRGRGHVLHPTLMEAHRENDYLKRHEEERNVPQARVRRLLKQGSGSEMLPVKPNWNMTVCNPYLAGYPADRFQFVIETKKSQKSEKKVVSSNLLTVHLFAHTL
jgi:hypothetical protein